MSGFPLHGRTWKDKGTVLCPVSKGQGNGSSKDKGTVLCPDFHYIIQLSTPENGKVVD